MLVAAPGILLLATVLVACLWLPVAASGPDPAWIDGEAAATALDNAFSSVQIWVAVGETAGVSASTEMLVAPSRNLVITPDQPVPGDGTNGSR